MDKENVLEQHPNIYIYIYIYILSIISMIFDTYIYIYMCVYYPAVN